MSKLQKIEVVFPVEVELPNGWERTLDALINMVCKQYEKENPDRVMWPAGRGCKPIWNEPHEPTYDDSVYFVSVFEREDLHGDNDHNPNQAQLRAAVHAARAKRREAKEGTS